MKRGFTLIELLLAIALMAIIMAVIYGVVVSTIQAQERVEEVTLGTEIGPVILNQIRQDLEAAFVPDKEKDWFVGVDRKGSVGDRDRVDFVTTTMSYGSEEEHADAKFHSVNEVGYLVDDNRQRSGELVLYRREDLFIDEDPLRGGRLTALYDRVQAFDVQYWNGKEWVATWSSKEAQGKLPDAVKVEIKMYIPDKTREGNAALRTFSITVVTPK